MWFLEAFWEVCAVVVEDLLGVFGVNKGDFLLGWFWGEFWCGWVERMYIFQTLYL